MPEITRFYGIIIRMFIEVGQPHHRPHFHAHYQDMGAAYSINPIEVLRGGLPRKQARYVETWAQIHQAELQAAWENLQAGILPGSIEPLH